MVLQPWQRTARTVLQVLIALAAGMPLIVNATGLDEALPGIALMLTVSAGVSRVMALSVVNKILPDWLRADSDVVAAVVDGQVVSGPADDSKDGTPVTVVPQPRHAAPEGA